MYYSMFYKVHHAHIHIYIYIYTYIHICVYIYIYRIYFTYKMKYLTPNIATYHLQGVVTF